MHQLNSLQELFVHELRDLYSAEQQLVSALPKMARAATTRGLQEAFTMHLEETRNHVSRLERVFNSLGTTSAGKECEAMKGLIKEGEEVINMKGDSTVKDAALIAAAQRVEHYEIAGYGTARTFADKLGFSDAADILQDTLDEEGSADKKLTSLAEGSMFTTGINEKAMTH
ncbi:MAG: ferritin-like domain-containing protein [Chloroflexi bacterium]|nr:ferritin-like domain-containing protein [Chloroflexota bacterium]MBP8058504.1 ferritin-like domain-containing protein [Chloroflexota bacterium]